MLEDFSKLLQILRKSRGLSQEKLAEMCELDRTYISMLERGIKNPTLQTLLKLSNALEIRLDQFIAKLYGPPTKVGTKAKEITLPLMGTSVSCGSPISDEHYIEKEISLDQLVIEDAASTFFIKSAGDSMFPNIQEGDLLVISKNLSPRNNQIVLAQVENEFTVKRFIKNRNQIQLRPDNSLYNTLHITKEHNLQICGVVTSIIRLL